MYYVPNTAAFCRGSVECFLGTVYRYFLVLYLQFPWTQWLLVWRSISCSMFAEFLYSNFCMLTSSQLPYHRFPFQLLLLSSWIINRSNNDENKDICTHCRWGIREVSSPHKSKSVPLIFLKVLSSSLLSLCIHLNHFYFPLFGHSAVGIRENRRKGAVTVLT
jgi:hypothetical protein